MNAPMASHTPNGSPLFSTAPYAPHQRFQSFQRHNTPPAMALRQPIQPDTFSQRLPQPLQPFGFDPYLAEGIRRSKLSFAEEVRFNADTAEAIRRSKLDPDLTEAIRRSKITYKEEARFNADTAEAIRRSKLDPDLAEAIRRSKVTYKEEVRFHADLAEAKRRSIRSYAEEISKKSLFKKTPWTHKPFQRSKPETLSGGVNQAAVAGVLKTSQMFGTDLKSIQFQQGNANTCYLLSALDNIFHHPQGEKILDLIKIKQSPTGYSVKFPSQPHEIKVRNHELGKYTQSSTPGVALLEQAYLKLPGAKTPLEYDNTHDALARIFGSERLRESNVAATTLKDSLQQQHAAGDFADIWTTTRRVKNRAGQPVKTGSHYFSVRRNPDDASKISLVNPYRTQTVEQTLTHSEFGDAFWPELNRIRIR
ncbi:hypothetical protein [Vampirovibrio sp.]|uniref:hypothetical protein n=1 Tax=Vampirovibrio sp. TaxID=2717857 RepID=UPI00359310BF